MEKFSSEECVTDSGSHSPPDIQLNLRLGLVDAQEIDTNGSNEICSFSKHTFSLPSTYAKLTRTHMCLVENEISLINRFCLKAKRA